MRGSQVWGTIGVCLVTLTALAIEPVRKAGLWESTTSMTWDKSPGMAMPAMPSQTLPVCVTQEMIDKYGGNIPQTRGGCQLTNVSMKPGGMTADMVCTGAMDGKASIQTTWSDAEHASSTVHFVGEMKMGPNTSPVEWTSKTSSVFKSADCGSVKPVVIPAK